MGDSSSSVLAAPGPLGRGVQLEVPLGQHGRAAAVVPPRERPQPGRELQQAERLDQVVVRAGVQAADPVADLVAGGEHQHGHPDTGLPQPAAQLEAVEAGQHDVQDDRRIGILGRHPQAVRAVAGDVNGMALLLERALDQARHPHLVLDHQHPHASEATQSQM